MTKTRDLADLGGGFIQAGTGAVQRTVESKLQDVVSVKDFGATGIYTQDATQAFNDALARIASQGGGALYVPKGQYSITAGAVTFSAAVGLTIYGDGPQNTIISFNGAPGNLFTVAMPVSNTAAIVIRDLTFYGTGGASPQGTGLILGDFINQGGLHNVLFDGLGTGLVLKDVYHCEFSSVRFKNYVTGVTGFAGTAANNNGFYNCYFGDGAAVSPAVAKPIVSYNMGYNTFVSCNFESRGYIQTVDMTNGSGYDTFIGCRLEQLNSGTADWLTVGNNQQYINTTFWPSSSYNCVNTTKYLVNVNAGLGNRFDGITVEGNYAANTLLLGSGSRENYVKVVAPSAGDSLLAAFNVVIDRGIGNTIEYPGGSFQLDRVTTWGGYNTNQNIVDSAYMTTATVDGLTVSAIGGYSTASLGPHEDGYSKQLSAPTGNRRLFWTLPFASTAGYTYTFSVWLLASTPGQTVDIYLDTSGSSPTYRQITLGGTDRWERHFIAIRPVGGASIYAGIRLNAGSGSVYISGPQLEEYANSANRFGPSGYVRSSTATGGQNYHNEVYPRPLTSSERFGTNVPTIGRFTRGSIVWNLDAAAGGVPGWVCVASGAPGTWRAMANLVP